MSNVKSDQEVTHPESQTEASTTPVPIQIRRLEKLETTSPSQGASN